MIHVALEPLSKFLTLYLKAAEELREEFQNIADQDFGFAKDRICMFKELVPLLENLRKKYVRLDEQTCLQILGAALEGDVEQAKGNVKGNSGTNKQNNIRPSSNPTTSTAGMRLVWEAISSGKSDMESAVGELGRCATEAAMQISDSQFLSQLEQDVELYSQLIPRFKIWADRARQKAIEHLEVGIMKALKKLAPAVHKIQQEECTEQIMCEYRKRAEEDQDKLRMDLIKHVNGLSTQSTYSCVPRP